MNIKSDSLLDSLLVESSIDAMIAVSNEDKVIVWNQAAISFYNKTQQEALDQDLIKILPSIEDDTEILNAIKLAKNGMQSFVPASRQLPHRLHVEIHVIPLKVDEKVIGVMLLVHDVAHRILKESELQRLNHELSNRLRQLGITIRELAYLTHMAGHNIKEPLRTMYTAIEWMIKTEATNMTNVGRASFRRIQSSLNRMTLLIDDIITLTQISIVEKPALHIKLEDVVADVKKSVNHKLNETKTVLTLGDLCEIKAHYDQVHLLLQHVLNNVMRFNSSDKPFVNIECKKVKVEENASNDLKGEYFELTITHNGYGFSERESNTEVSIKDTSKEINYLGLGIASLVASKVMEAHDGLFVLDDSVEGSVKIKCYFPVETADRRPRTAEH